MEREQALAQWFQVTEMSTDTISYIQHGIIYMHVCVCVCIKHTSIMYVCTWHSSSAWGSASLPVSALSGPVSTVISPKLRMEAEGRSREVTARVTQLVSYRGRIWAQEVRLQPSL